MKEETEIRYLDRTSMRQLTICEYREGKKRKLKCTHSSEWKKKLRSAKGVRVKDKWRGKREQHAQTCINNSKFYFQHRDHIPSQDVHYNGEKARMIQELFQWDLKRLGELGYFLTTSQALCNNPNSQASDWVISEDVKKAIDYVMEVGTVHTLWAWLLIWFVV